MKKLVPLLLALLLRKLLHVVLVVNKAVISQMAN